MSLSDLPNELGERGIWWQVVGFAIAGCISVAILQIWDGSDFWAYRSFEIAVKDLYWLFVLPLAGVIEGARKVFEKASEIRAAQRAKIWQRGLDRGREQGLKEGREAGREEGREEALAKIRSRLQDSDVSRDPESGRVTLTLTPEDVNLLLGSSADTDSGD